MDDALAGMLELHSLIWKVGQLSSFSRLDKDMLTIHTIKGLFRAMVIMVIIVTFSPYAPVSHGQINFN